MEEIKKEIAELKVLVSKLLEIQEKEFQIKYGYLNSKQSYTNPKY